MTQQELAKALGISKLTVSQWETGYRNPSLLAINALEMLGELHLLRGPSSHAVEKRLKASFDHLNRFYFDNELKSVTFRLSKRMSSTYGHISPKKRLITISAPYMEKVDWKTLQKTLIHEMIHLWLYQKKKPWGHTKEFKNKLKSILKFAL